MKASTVTYTIKEFDPDLEKRLGPVGPWYCEPCSKQMAHNCVRDFFNVKIDPNPYLKRKANYTFVLFDAVPDKKLGVFSVSVDVKPVLCQIKRI